MRGRLLTGIKASDQASVGVYEGDVTVTMPMTLVVDADEARVRTERVIRGNRELFKRLA